MGRPAQRVDRRETAAEAVERDPYAEAAQGHEALLQGVEGDARVAVGDLDHQGPRGQAVAGQQRFDGVGGRGRVEQPGGGEPDGDGDGVPGPGPVGGLGHRLLQEPAAELGGALVVAGDPEELGGREQDALGGTPAGLGGDGGDGTAGEVDDGLVEQGELALAQGGAQPGGQLGAAYDVGLHLGAYSSTRSLPPALARYIARSALRMRSVGLMAGSAKATPMEAATRTSLGPIR